MNNEKLSLSSIIEEAKKQTLSRLEDFLENYTSGNEREDKTKEEWIEWLKDAQCGDSISQYADSEVDIYNWKLIEWFGENPSSVNEYVEEFGIDAKNFDIFKVLQGAQYMEIERELNEEIGEFIKTLE